MTSPWVWVVVGIATAHVGWAFAFVGWWVWLTRGDRAKLQRAQREFDTARKAIRESRHIW